MSRSIIETMKGETLAKRSLVSWRRVGPNEIVSVKRICYDLGDDGFDWTLQTRGQTGGIGDATTTMKVLREWEAEKLLKEIEK